MTIPAYLIEFTDPSGTDHICRASAQEQYPHLNPISHAYPNRHKFFDSLAILGRCWRRWWRWSLASCAAGTKIRSETPLLMRGGRCGHCRGCSQIRGEKRPACSS